MKRDRPALAVATERGQVGHLDEERRERDVEEPLPGAGLQGNGRECPQACLWV